MTEQNNELEDSGEENRAKGKVKRLIFMVLAMLGVAALSVGATLVLTGVLGGDEPVEQQVQDPDAPPTERAHYLALNPNFVVTYEVNNRQRFLQVELAVRARDQETLDQLTRHMPRVRNNIISALSDRTFNDIRTHEGREELVDVLVEVLQDIAEENTGRRGVETVLFSNFVLQ